MQRSLLYFALFVDGEKIKCPISLFNISRTDVVRFTPRIVRSRLSSVWKKKQQRYMDTLYTAVMALKWFAKHIYAGPAEQQSNELDEISSNNVRTIFGRSVHRTVAREGEIWKFQLWFGLTWSPTDSAILHFFAMLEMLLAPARVCYRIRTRPLCRLGRCPRPG